jgi:hypothetical protein
MPSINNNNEITCHELNPNSNMAHPGTLFLKCTHQIKKIIIKYK